MRARVALPLIAFAGLAACSGKKQPTLDNGEVANLAAMNEQQRAQVEHRAPDPDIVMKQRWAAIFDQPAKLVAALNDMGYKVGGYTQASHGAGYAATGQQQVLPSDEATPPATVKTNVTATGASADHVDKVVFTFDTHVSGDPESDKVHDILGYPRQIINGVLQRFQVGPGDPIVQALTQISAATSSEHGATITVEATPGNGQRFVDQHIVVTVSRSADGTNNQD